ncbi:MAG: RNA polymerase sigma factor [Acidimicrobiales bacterium]
MRGRRLDRQRSLVTLARQGDRSAMTDLLRQHDGAMRALAWRMVGDADLVDDILQDAYLKAYRSIGGFLGKARFGTWLHRIVANTCVDHLRQRAARAEVSIEVQPVVGVPAEVDRWDDTDCLRRALLSLPYDQRAALLLIDYDGYSYQDAADALGISVTAVGSRLYRARASLQRIGELT